MGDNIIALENIGKIFGTGDNAFCALDNIHLQIKRGEFVAIIGQSGSGKSTLMNILGALDKPSSGKYFLSGKDVSLLSNDDLSAVRLQEFGFVFQRYNLLNALSAGQNVALPAVYSGMTHEARQSRAQDLLALLSLGDKFSSAPNQLSGGQQQRVSIARALMNGAEVILADEPTGALDSKSGEAVLKILANLHRAGKTVILITHDQAIAAHAQRIIEIADGKIIGEQQGAAYNSSQDNVALPPLPASQVQSKFKKSAWQLLEAVNMARLAIVAHKMRALLTMLGIIIGIAAVSVAVALGNGTASQVLENISSLGTNTISIYPGQDFGDVRAQKVQSLQVGDAAALQRLAFVDSVSPEVGVGGSLLYAAKDSTAQLSGVAANYVGLKNLQILRGRFFDEQEVIGSAQLAVVDESTAQALFGDIDHAVGKTVLFNKQPLKIIGVAKLSDAFANNRNWYLWAPYSTVMRRLTGGTALRTLTVKIDENISAAEAQTRMGALLERRHQRRDFFMMSADEIRQSIEQTTTAMTMLITGVAILSLLVGGIGVMNIMLVSVTERTREIGIRMAIGASRRNIQQQFLIEAGFLCLLGGLLGVALAYIVGWIFNAVATEYRMEFSQTATLLALCSATLIGIIFGYTPAKRAAKLQPIAALAHE